MQCDVDGKKIANDKIFQAFTEGFCTYKGFELDVLTNMQGGVDKCFSACTAYSGCAYYVWREETKECKLYSETDDYFDCDLMRGPATPDVATVSNIEMKCNLELK